MRPLRMISRAVSILVLGSCPSFVAAQKTAEPVNFPDFTAIQRLGAGKRPLLTKVYLSGSSVRVEQSPKVATLYVISSRKIYRLVEYPDKSKSCVVMRTDQEQGSLSPLELLQGTKVERTPAGTEVIAGHSCKIEDIVVTRPGGKTITSKVWEADDFKGVPIKIVSDTGHGNLGALYGDIVLGKLDQALFTPPDKCTPIEKEGQVVEKKTID